MVDSLTFIRLFPDILAGQYLMQANSRPITIGEQNQANLTLMQANSKPIIIIGEQEW